MGIRGHVQHTRSNAWRVGRVGFLDQLWNYGFKIDVVIGVAVPILVVGVFGLLVGVLLCFGTRNAQVVTQGEAVVLGDELTAALEVGDEWVAVPRGWSPPEGAAGFVETVDGALAVRTADQPVLVVDADGEVEVVEPADLGRDELDDVAQAARRQMGLHRLRAAGHDESAIVYALYEPPWGRSSPPAQAMIGLFLECSMIGLVFAATVALRQSGGSVSRDDDGQLRSQLALAVPMVPLILGRALAVFVVCALVFLCWSVVLGAPFVAAAVLADGRLHPVPTLLMLGFALALLLGLVQVGQLVGFLRPGPSRTVAGAAMSLAAVALFGLAGAVAYQPANPLWSGVALVVPFAAPSIAVGQLLVRPISWPMLAWLTSCVVLWSGVAVGVTAFVIRRHPAYGEG